MIEETEKSPSLALRTAGNIFSIAFLLMMIFLVTKCLSSDTNDTKKVLTPEEKIVNTLHSSGCRSSWDGSFHPVKQLLKNSMKNPASFEHVETKIIAASTEKDFIIFVTKVRGTNSFNAVVTQMYKVDLKISTCEITDISEIK